MEYQNTQAQASQYAGVGSRFLALLIDGIILGIIAGILVAILGVQRASISSSTTGLIGIIYFIVLEKIYGGTLGKKALGLRVTREDGAPISWSESIIRNLLRIIDGLVGYLVGAIIIWNSPLKQRLGDKLAHTVVVKTR